MPTIAAAVIIAIAPPQGMRWVPPGEFIMGTADAAAPPNERPAHRVRLAGFWIDEHEVTNAHFRVFVEATGYATVAERPVSWAEISAQLPPGVPRPPESALAPGSLVFASPPPSDDQIPLHRNDLWWRWTPGASWRAPEGPGSTIDGREHHPVVHVAWEDAAAYAAWAGKQLPTEAQWERAARGGAEGTKFTWGDEPPSDEAEPRANIWHGDFPTRNTRLDGWDRTAPVGSFAPNGYGLHDMAGNVWEWCADWYRPDAYAQPGRAPTDAMDPDTECCIDPTGPAHSFDPLDPYAPKRITRGGSFLCHASYCESYRPAARRGTPPDTGMSHLGFRCVITPPTRHPAPQGANP